MERKVSFDLKKSPNPAAIAYSAFFEGNFIMIFRIIIQFYLAFSLFVFIVRYFEIFGFDITLYFSRYFAVTFIVLSIYLVEEVFRMFTFEKLKKLKLQIDIEELKKAGDINLADMLDFDLSSIIFKMLKRSQSEGFVVNNYSFFFFIVDSQPVQFIINRCGLYPSQVKNLFKESMKIKVTENREGISQSNIIKILSAALDESKKRDIDYLDTKSVFLALVSLTPEFIDILFKLKIEMKDLRSICAWHDELSSEVEKNSTWWEEGNQKHFDGIGADWAYAWTTTLSHFTSDISSRVRFGTPFGRAWGHEKEIEEMERILSLDGSNNVLLVGEPGIGKSAMVYELAQKIMEGRVNEKIRHEHVLDFRVGILSAEAKTKGDMEERIYQVLNESHNAGNIILLIDNVQDILKEEGLGSINASGILLQYLKSPRFQLIATISPKDYNECIAPQKELDSAFYKINVAEPSKENVFKVIRNTIAKMENKKRILFTYQSLKHIIKLTDEYIKYKPFPEKALKLMDEVATYVEINTKDTFVTPEHIEKVLSERLGFSISEGSKEEKEKLLNMEEFLHKRVIGQEPAIKAVSDALRRSRSGIRSKNRPIGVFLFLGPTGVGKTETTKALAELYFGSEEKMIRLDMSEYQSANSVDKLIGPPPGTVGSEKGGELTNAIRNDPFSVVLLDELEKANPNILTLFLQVFDDGRLSDSLGQTADFTNAIIIATSNAGSAFIQKYINDKKDVTKLGDELKRYLAEQKIFTPEFLNRFDNVISFSPLNEMQIIDVAKLLIASLQKRAYEKGITLEFEDTAIAKLGRLGFDPQFGARPMRRVMQEKVENFLAKKMLSGEASRGQKIIIKADDIN